MAVEKVTVEIGDVPIELETGKLAKQANGSVVVRSGDTVVLVTAVGAQEPRPGADFFPLTVDYEERMYAAGQDPRRLHQARVAAERPRDPDGAHDRPADPAALPEGLPQRDPGRRDGPVGRPGERVRHPLHHRRLGRADALGAALPGPGRRGPHRPDRRRVHHQPDPAGDRGVRARPHRRRHRRGHLDGRGGRQGDRRGDDARGAPDRPRGDPAPLRGPARAEGGGRQAEVGGRGDRRGREAPGEDREGRREGPGRGYPRAGQAARRDKVAARPRRPPPRRSSATTPTPRTAAAFSAAFEALQKRIIRERIAVDKDRPDGRRPTRSGRSAARSACCPRAHGSAIFTRGQTQVLTIVALGTTEEEQRIDGLGIETTKRYMHHYNFPPFSVGEAGRMRGPTAATSATARWPSGRCCRDPGRGRVPLHDAARLRDPREQRLVLDGVGLRQHAGADGRRRADHARRSPASRWAWSRRATSYTS